MKQFFSITLRQDIARHSIYISVERNVKKVQLPLMSGSQIHNTGPYCQISLGNSQFDCKYMQKLV